MKTVVIATNNKNKVYEFKSLLGNDNICFKTLKEIGYDKDIVEDGKYEELIAKNGFFAELVKRQQVEKQK